MLGIAVGAASLCKFSGIMLFIFLPLAAFATAFFQWRKWGVEDEPLALGRKTLGWGTAAFLIAELTINIGYGYDGTLTLLGNCDFQSHAFCAVRDWLPGWVPAPLPYPFLAALDAQVNQSGYEAYLLGTTNQTGFWNYYLVGLLVKTPEPILLLAAAAVFFRQRFLLREVPMLAVAIAFFVFFSLVGHKNIGVRYLLFLLPIAAVWIGRLTTSALWRCPRRVPVLRGSVALALAWLLTADLLIWPHYLAYFNTVSGGPSRGHEYLLDSNLDWGQDLITLREYMSREGIGSVDLAYFGTVDPAIYGIRFRPLADAVPRQRYVVVSANLLWGRKYFFSAGPTWSWPAEDYCYAPFRRLKPAAVLGYTLYVFDLAAQSPEAIHDYSQAVAKGNAATVNELPGLSSPFQK